MVMAEAKSVPYASNMVDSDWTLINENPASKTWEVVASGGIGDFQFAGTESGLKYNYDSNYPADDWAISPAIHLEAGKEYKVKFWYQTKSDIEKLTVYMAKGSTPAELKAGQVIMDFESNQTTGKKMVYVITPTETADYHIGLYLHSEKLKYTNWLTGFEVAENAFAPGTVTGMTATPGENRALEATLTWALPTTDNDGAPLPEGAVFNSVKVYRDGQLVATLGGDATTWKDTAAAGLTAGYHKYEVEVTVNGAKSAKAMLESRYIGPVEALTLPYNCVVANTSDDDIDTFYTFITGPTSTANKHWQLKRVSYVSAYDPTRFIQNTGSSSNVEDDWMMLPALKIEKAGIYRIGVKYKYQAASPKLVISYGNGNSIAAMTTEVGALTTKHEDWTYEYLVFEIKQPGEYTFGIHACSPSPSYYEYGITELSVEEWHAAPLHATGLNAAVEGNNVKLTWTNPAKNSIGGDLASISKVEVMRDGQLATTLTEGMTPGAQATWTDAEAPAGAHVYSVLPYLNEYAAEGTVPAVNAPWVGDKLQALPYSYSFNDAGLNTLFSTKDINGSAPDWTLSTSGATLAMKGTDLEYVKPNDVLYTPPFELTPGYYKVVASMKGAGKNYPIEIGYAADETSAILDPQTVKLSGSSYSNDYTVYVKVATAGRGVFAIKANDYIGEDYYDLVLTKIQIAAQPVVPELATEVTVTPGANEALEATISWKNPTASNLAGVAPELQKAVIYRDGTEIATVTEGLVAGEKSEYVDREVPNAGYYTYKVEIYSPEGCSTKAATAVKSEWIGGGITIGEEENAYVPNFNDWTIYDVNGDKTSYDTKVWSPTYSGDRMTLTSTSSNADDWAISPRLNFEAGRSYILSFTAWNALASSSSAEPAQFDIYTGKGNKVADMTNKVLTVVDINQTNANATQRQIRLKAVEATDAATQADEENDGIATYSVPAGVRTLGFYANTMVDMGIRGVSLYAEPKVMVGIDSIETDTDAETEYYTLQGIRVSNPGEGLYIMRRGGKTQKVLIRK